MFDSITSIFRYPSSFIEDQNRQFFMRHTVLLLFQPYLKDELEFYTTRENILGQTKTEPPSVSTDLINSVNHRPHESESKQQNHTVITENSATKLKDRFFYSLHTRGTISFDETRPISTVRTNLRKHTRKKNTAYHWQQKSPKKQT